MEITKLKIKNYRSGFVLLFAVTLASILLAIAIGVSNVALKEVNFSTSARSSSEAIFSADTLVECALYYDRGDLDRFRWPNPGGTISCGTSANITPAISGNATAWSYIFPATFGSAGGNCAVLTISKDASSPPVVNTTIVSKGYNIGDASCNSSSQSRTERELLVYYGISAGAPPPPRRLPLRLPHHHLHLQPLSAPVGQPAPPLASISAPPTPIA